MAEPSIFGRPYGSTTSPVEPQAPAKASFDWGKAGSGISALGDVMGGINALSTGKTNAKLSKQYGKEAFDGIMSEVKQRVGQAETVQGASGLISQSAKDVISAGSSKGATDAARKKREFDIQAANQKYEGRMGMAKGLMGAGQSILSMK